MKIKKTFVMLVALLFIVTSTGAIINAVETKTQQTSVLDVVSHSQYFVQPQIVEHNDFTTISLRNVKSSTISMTDRPLLPVERMVYEFPLGTVIDDVIVSYSEITTQYITKPVQPTPIPEPYTITPRYERTVDVDYTFNGYDFTGYFPQSWFDYSIGVGLNSENEQTVFLTVSVYPVRYSYQDSLVQYISDVSVDILYDSSNLIQPMTSSKDFLIISAPAYLND
ncbi:MAG: hypothetical protein R6V50_07810, partial [Thermoplasmatota archaeon]